MAWARGAFITRGVTLGPAKQRRRRVGLGLAAFLATLPSACFSPRIAWREVPAGERPLDEVWSTVVRSAERHGLRTDHAGTDQGLREFRSVWRVRTLGFGRTNRIRMHAKVEPEAPPPPYRWLVRFRIERQDVPDMAKAMNPEESDWDAAGQESGMEDVVQRQLEMWFRVPEKPRE
jgi:hypothetical protein